MHDYIDVKHVFYVQTDMVRHDLLSKDEVYDKRL